MTSVPRLQFGFLLWISLACTNGVCQSAAQAGSPVQSATPTIHAPLDAQLTQQTPAREAVKPDETIQLSLQQAIRMALEKNLDIQLEQLDQSVADFSVTRTKGGGTPR